MGEGSPQDLPSWSTAQVPGPGSQAAPRVSSCRELLVWPDLANKRSGHHVQFAFQINKIFSINMPIILPVKFTENAKLPGSPYVQDLELLGLGQCRGPRAPPFPRPGGGGGRAKTAGSPVAPPSCPPSPLAPGKWGPFLSPRSEPLVGTRVQATSSREAMQLP